MKRYVSIRLFGIEHCQSGLDPYNHYLQYGSSSHPLNIKDKAFRKLVAKHLVTGCSNQPHLCHDKLAPYARRHNMDTVLTEYTTAPKGVITTFKSIPQLRSWFPDDDLKILHSQGFNLVVYTTDVKGTVHFTKRILVLEDKKIDLQITQNLISLVRCFHAD